MTAAYTTSAECRAYMDIPANDSSHDALIQALIPRVQSILDGELGRSFVATSGTRYYPARGVRLVGQTLYLGEDLYSLGSITNGDGSGTVAGTAISSANVWLEPWNGPPYNMITLHPGEVWIWNTTGQVGITGSWGYSSAAPGAINQLATRLVCYLYKLREAQSFDVVADAATGLVTVPKGIPADCRKIIDQWRRRT